MFRSHLVHRQHETMSRLQFNIKAQNEISKVKGKQNIQSPYIKVIVS